MKKEHLLVIRFSALGDVAMTVPIIWAVAQQYPDLRITVLSKPVARAFFEELAPNVNFMEADLKGEYHGVKGLNALYRRLVAKQFTAIADLHNVLRSEYLRLRFTLGLFRVAHIDKHRKQRRQLVAPGKKKYKKPLPSSFHNYLDVFARLGYPVDIRQHCFRSLFPEGGGDLSMLAQPIAPKQQDEPWIGIAPTAAHEGKIYPTPLMEQVIEGLIKTHSRCRIFLFGRGQQEDRLFQQWEQQWPQCVAVSRQTANIKEELILMSHLDVMVSMDSANQHLASLTATPVVSIWGATHPYAGFLGWQQSEQNAIQTDLPCRPCSIYGQKPCKRGDFACMNNIKPITIIEKINQIIN